MTTLVSTPSFSFLHNIIQTTTRTTNIIYIYTFGKKETIGNITKITFPVKRIRPWQWKTLENGGLHSAITTHGSKLVGGGRMNENAIHGGPKKGWEWRIALSNDYAWLQTLRWTTHERKRNSWGSEKGLRMENCTKQSLHMAPNSKVEDTWTKTQFMGVRKRVENGELH